MTTDITIRVNGACSKEHLEKVSGIIARNAQTYTGSDCTVLEDKHHGTDIPTQRDVTSVELQALVEPYTGA